MNQHTFRLAVAGILGAGAMLAAAGSAQAATEHQLTIANAPPFPNATQTAPLFAVNGPGEVVGTSFYQDLEDTQPTIGKDYLRLSIPGDLAGRRHTGEAFDINDAGATVGYSQASALNTMSGFGVERPYIWDGSTTVGRELDILPNKSVEPHAINSAGDIVGLSFAGNGIDTVPAPKGLLLDHTGSLTTLPPLPNGKTSKAAAINDDGLIAGQADAGDKNHQFPVLWRNGVPTNLGGLPGATFGAAVGVNRSGAAVGFSTTPVGGSHAVLFANGTVTDLNFTGKANAINDAGTIVGTSGKRAIRYQARQAVDLNTLIALGSGFTLRAANWTRGRTRPWASSSPPFADRTLVRCLTPRPLRRRLLSERVCGMRTRRRS